MLEIANLISLALTVPYLYLCWKVLSYYGKGAWLSARRSHPTAVEWLIIGVCVGFLGSALDNIWWGIAWFGDLLGLPFRDFFFTYGVASNVFARQAAGVMSALCHIAAVYTHIDRPAAVGQKIQESYTMRHEIKRIMWRFIIMFAVTLAALLLINQIFG